MVRLNFEAIEENVQIDLPTSKSISNRLLIAQALSSNAFEISGLSKAEDSNLLSLALSCNDKVIDVGMAGTAYRFLTAFLALKKGTKVLTGANRMKERPIQILVDVLRKLGAEIQYMEQEGYPPLKIEGRRDLIGSSITIDGSVSSQYITALLLIAPYLKEGLDLKLLHEVTSLPYINLSISLMKQLNVAVSRKSNHIQVSPGYYYSTNEIAVETDWSSASFFYQIVAFTKQEIKLKGLIADSIQGDVACAQLFEYFGVHTEFIENGVLLSPIPIINSTELELDLIDTPDLIPSIVVCASQLITKTRISGVKSLRIKESNRVTALQTELVKYNSLIEEEDLNTIIIHKVKSHAVSNLRFNSYNDHRMAMCLAPLVCIYNSIFMDSEKVVEKSFPGYWHQLIKLGVKIDELN